MRRFMQIYSSSFEDLSQMHENRRGTVLDSRVSFICADQTYTTRSRRGAANSEHYILSTEDMADVVKTMDAMLMPGGHGVLFCSSLQFRDSYDAFTQYRGDGEPCTKPVRHTKRRRRGQVCMA